MSACINRLSICLSNSSARVININTTENTLFSLTSVRFRKRRDQIRRAPSKIYYVREPTPKDTEEMAFLNVEMKRYNTKVKSILSFLKSQEQPLSQMVKEGQVATDNVQDDLARAFELNDAWNESVAKQRTARVAADAIAVQKIRDEKLTEAIEKMQLEQTVAKDVLKSVIERRAQAIDMDNLDEELEQFLDSEPINHNFAITATGERVK